MLLVRKASSPYRNTRNDDKTSGISLKLKKNSLKLFSDPLRASFCSNAEKLEDGDILLISNVAF
jgi:hypothetical protein